jgi:glycosyltransferase involved in cell wall biosynthesis
LARLSDRVITVSANEFEHAQEIGIPVNRLVCIPNGIVAGKSHVERIYRESQADESTVKIGFIGRLVSQKAVDHLLSAFALVKAAQQGSIQPALLIAGDGPLGESLRAHSHSLGLDDSVTWLGDVGGSDLLGRLDILCIASDYEGFPYVKLEGMMAGLPIVSTDVGGAAELIREDVNGYIVPRRDVNALANALALLVADPKLRARLGEASFQIVQEFSVNRMASEITNAYRKVIDEHGGSQVSRLRDKVTNAVAQR